MALEYKIEAIDVWPGTATSSWQRSRSPFKTIWTKVLTHLERELKMLGGKNIVVRLQVSGRDVRLDGMLRADARPREPGVVLQFTAGNLKDKPTLLYRCDRFSYWQDNLSAIARALEALRLVDRYGVTPTGEQYAGFKALPSTTEATMDSEAAAKVICDMHDSYHPSELLKDPAAAKEAIRVAIFRTHPDRNKGDRFAFDEVERAKRVLTAHHGVAL